MLARAGTTCRCTSFHQALPECTVWNIKASVTKRTHSFRLVDTSFYVSLVASLIYRDSTHSTAAPPPHNDKLLLC
jgi:hypothetical protein